MPKRNLKQEHQQLNTVDKNSSTEGSEGRLQISSRTYCQSLSLTIIWQQVQTGHLTDLGHLMNRGNCQWATAGGKEQAGSIPSSSDSAQTRTVAPPTGSAAERHNQYKNLLISYYLVSLKLVV
ncbi:UNVERIFIED_CONTAM: hypothetical protein K2H54_030933 [Gekko kuhli]